MEGEGRQMSRPSRAWLILICLLSYFSMGQAGCQTTSQNEITYVRSDIVRLRRDVEDIKKTLDTPAPKTNTQGIMRNQAAQRETLLELKEGQQRAESRIEETRYELAALRQEITKRRRPPPPRGRPEWRPSR
jgi:predicted  nucleic acid-binding Zn-ribbon protein